MSARAWIGLGANLGDARETIERALKALGETRGIQSLIVAPLYGSDPVDAQGPTFVNTVAQIHTTLAPLALLDALQAIEQAHGRERPFRNAPRTLDLDLLLYEGVEMETPRLTLPHPRMHERAFVLRPLSELTPDLVLKQGSLQTLLEQCSDQKLWPLPL
ncbi:2-amino-4-hydroxy-6-hydroxymethyldihydropteridine diphosphokinase [Zwartia sp.]|uniref:2-amino-4-hydroxy-6- hydroxymethyldihydropteridine diphosphokinase n=1 Tax=Zwartia sp. TaxID=2978004 RepID=UPI003BB0D549